MKLIAPILLALLMAAPAFGQHWCGQACTLPHCEAPAFHGGGSGPGPGGPGGPGDWREGPPRKMVEGFRLYKLTEFLELSEDQTEKVYPRIAEMNRLHDEHREQIQAKMKELETLVDEEKAGEAAKLAMEIHKLRGDFQALMHGKQGELMKLLSDEQQAKYVLFESRFEGHLQNVAGRMRERLGEHREGRMGERREEFRKERLRDQREESRPDRPDEPEDDQRLRDNR